MKIERNPEETFEQSSKADDVARECAAELVDHWIATRATTPQLLRRLDMPMPGASEYGQLSVALADAGCSFTPARLTAFNNAWSDQFRRRQQEAELSDAI